MTNDNSGTNHTISLRLLTNIFWRHYGLNIVYLLIVIMLLLNTIAFITPLLVLYFILLIFQLITLITGLFRFGIKGSILFIIKLGITCFIISITILRINHIDQQWQQNADLMITKLQQYYQEHQYYPDPKTKLNIFNNPLGKKFRYFYHLNEFNQPVFFYHSPLMIFDHYDYNFQRNEWNYISD